MGQAGPIPVISTAPIQGTAIIYKLIQIWMRTRMKIKTIRCILTLN